MASDGGHTSETCMQLTFENEIDELKIRGPVCLMLYYDCLRLWHILKEWQQRHSKTYPMVGRRWSASSDHQKREEN
jgi:hypothetical protein